MDLFFIFEILTKARGGRQITAEIPLKNPVNSARAN